MPPPLDPAPACWHLVVVRGEEPGRAYPLDGRDFTLGSGVDGDRALIRLADQEGTSPRRMAARHAALGRSPATDGWMVRDLDTPGGTFHNNRRVLPGVAQPLGEGDTIQLGSVQLRLVRSVAPVPITPAAASTPTASFLYRSSRSGTSCRTWDDFLILAAQRWDELRGDLEAGRLADFARSIGRLDLAPGPARPDESPDERLDAWLARLPTRVPAVPELDVHPLRVVVAAAHGGGSVRRKVRVGNVGHRLLRVRVEVAPGGDLTLRLDPEIAGRELIVRDFADVAFEVVMPDPLAGTLLGALVIAGAGESRRVAVVVERKATSAADPDPAPAEPASLLVANVGRSVRAMSVAQRVVLGALVLLLARLQVGILGGTLGDRGLAASGPDAPALGLEALALAGVGGLTAGIALARIDGGPGVLWGSLGGAGLGVLLAALLVATCRAVEPFLGPWSASIPAVFGLWTVLGAGVGLAAGWCFPVRAAVVAEEAAR